MILHAFGAHFCAVTSSAVYRICLFPATIGIIISIPLAGRVLEEGHAGGSRSAAKSGVPLRAGGPAVLNRFAKQGLAFAGQKALNRPAPFRRPSSFCATLLHLASPIRPKSGQSPLFFPFDIRPRPGGQKAGKSMPKGDQKPPKSSEILENPIQFCFPCPLFY